MIWLLILRAGRPAFVCVSAGSFTYEQLLGNCSPLRYGKLGNKRGDLEYYARVVLDFSQARDGRTSESLFSGDEFGSRIDRRHPIG